MWSVQKVVRGGEPADYFIDLMISEDWGQYVCPDQWRNAKDGGLPTSGSPDDQSPDVFSGRGVYTVSPFRQCSPCCTLTLIEVIVDCLQEQGAESESD